MKMCVGILAGGKSSRMGSNKAFLTYKENSFIEVIARECEEFSRIIISTNQTEAYKNLGYKLVKDEREGFGPLEGIYQIIKKIDTEYVLILATDMPHIKKSFLQKFTNSLQELKESKEGDNEMPACMVLRAGGRIQPLCSIYSKKTLPAIELMREKEEHKLRILFDRVDTRYVDIENLGFTIDMVTNINTRDDYKEMINDKNK